MEPRALTYGNGFRGRGSQKGFPEEGSQDSDIGKGSHKGFPERAEVSNWQKTLKYNTRNNSLVDIIYIG